MRFTNCPASLPPSIRKPIRGLGWVLLIAATVVLEGCAFGARNATLRYPPQAEPSGGPVARAATAPAGQKGQIALAAFSDARTDKKLVGAVRNGFGMRTAEVVSADSVPTWVTGALKTELTASGYQVTDKVDESGAGTSLGGDVTLVWCDAYFTYSGEVALSIRLRRDGRDVLSRSYTGQGSAGMNWAATAEAYGQTLSIALADALRQLMPDLDKALQAP